MFRMFVRNASQEIRWNPGSVGRLFQAVAEAAGVPMYELEVFLENTPYRRLRENGLVLSHYEIHVEVEWPEGHDLAAKKKIAKAVYDFLSEHGVGEASDLIFRDSPLGETFFYEGEQVV